jgi:hypothetical protein
MKLMKLINLNENVNLQVGDIVYLNDLFIYFSFDSDTAIGTSTDGIKWAIQQSATTPYDVAYGNNLYVYYRNTEISTGTNLITYDRNTEFSIPKKAISGTGTGRITSDEIYDAYIKV